METVIESKGGTFTAVHFKSSEEVMSREAKFEMMLDEIDNYFERPVYPIEITMPCGSKTTWKSREEVPRETVVMCPCGDPGHKIVEVDMGTWIEEAAEISVEAMSANTKYREGEKEEMECLKS